MLFSTNLLKQRVSLPADYTALNKECIDKLFEIEHGETQRQLPNLLVVGKVTDVKKHPNADTLFVCQVHCGSHGDFQICTGGENVAAGQFVPTALPGCYLPSIDLTIGARTMRGEDSNGMICSKGELGINEDEDKHWIWSMSEDLACNDSMVGKSVKEVFPWMENIVFEVESVAITNRPDLRGHMGLAIEAKAIFSQSQDQKIDTLISNAQQFNINNTQYPQELSHDKIISIQTPKCSYYSLSHIQNALNTISVFPGRVSLLDLGHTPRRNRVDYSNYFMSLTTQPIHIFDTDKIIGSVTIKEATGGELFTDLTDKEHILATGDIIICDDEKILALGGIIGGASSCFDENTKNISIEIAHFDPIQIRKTSTRLGLKTDAAVRFEKGINPLRTAFCVSENLEILTHNNDVHKTGAISHISQIINTNFPAATSTITVSLNKACEYVTGSINQSTIDSMLAILRNLGYTIRHPEEQTEYIELTVPIWRSDIIIKEDVYEDLARHIGLNNIPEIASPLYPTRRNHSLMDFQYKLSDYLICHSKLNQVECYPRYSSEWIAKLDLSIESHFELLNPTDANTPYMAQSLLPGLLELAKKNYRITNPIRIFEIGKTFTLHETEISTKKVLTILSLKKKEGQWLQESFIDCRSVLDQIIKQFNIKHIEFNKNTAHYLHPNKQSILVFQGKRIGSTGQFHPMFLDQCGFNEGIEVSYLELDLVQLFSLQGNHSKFYHSNQDQLISKDLSFEIPATESYEQIMTIISKIQNIENIEIFDLYKAEGSDKKSISIRFSIIGDGSMTNEKIGAFVNNIITEVEKTGAILKGVKYEGL